MLSQGIFSASPAGKMLCNPPSVKNHLTCSLCRHLISTHAQRRSIATMNTAVVDNKPPPMEGFEVRTAEVTIPTPIVKVKNPRPTATRMRTSFLSGRRSSCICVFTRPNQLREFYPGSTSAQGSMSLRASRHRCGRYRYTSTLAPLFFCSSVSVQSGPHLVGMLPKM